MLDHKCVDLHDSNYTVRAGIMNELYTSERDLSQVIGSVILDLLL
jgi:hypothetical protein